MTLEAELANLRFLNYSADTAVAEHRDENPLILYLDNGKSFQPQANQQPPFRQIQIIHMKQNDLPLPPLTSTNHGSNESSASHRDIMEDPESETAEIGNQIKFECHECGQKFDRLVRLTEHNCYEEDPFSKKAKPLQRVSVPRSSNVPNQRQPQYFTNSHLSTSSSSNSNRKYPNHGHLKHSNQVTSKIALASDMIKCPYCGCIFNQSYFDKYHLQKCSEAVFKEEQLITFERSPYRKKKKAANQIRTGFGRRSSEMKRKRQHKLSIASILRPVKTWVCEQCGQVFKTGKQQKNHFCIYLDYKPFVCLVCNLVFSTRNGLYRHEEKTHSNCYAVLRAKLKQDTPHDFKNAMPLYELSYSVENFLRRRSKASEFLRAP